ATSAVLQLVVHLLEKRVLLDAPLLLELEQLAALVPLDAGLLEELAERRRQVGLADADRPELRVLARQRHFVAVPFRIAAGQRRFDQRVVEQEGDAVAALQGIE